MDFDDVVLDFNRGFMSSHNNLYGTKITYEQLNNFDDWEITYGCDKETMAKRTVNFYNSDEHHLTGPVSGAIGGISELAKDYHLEIVTSRPEISKAATLRWIDKHFKDTFRNFHFTNMYAGAKGSHARSKSEVCKEIGAEVLIDDALKHAKDVAGVGIPALLPDRPWNQGEAGDRVYRVHTWEEIVNWIRKNL